MPHESTVSPYEPQDDHRRFRNSLRISTCSISETPAGLTSSSVSKLMGQVEAVAPGETNSNMPDTPKVLTHHEEFDDDDDEDSDEPKTPSPVKSPFFSMQS